MSLCIAEMIDAKRRMACQYIKIAVAVKQRSVHANRNRGDETVNQLADGLSPATAKPVEGGRFLVVLRFRWNASRPREQAAKVAQMPLVPGTGKNLHANGIANDDVLAKNLPDTTAFR